MEVLLPVWTGRESRAVLGYLKDQEADVARPRFLSRGTGMLVVAVLPGRGIPSRQAPSGLPAASKESELSPWHRKQHKGSAPNRLLCNPDRKEFAGRAGKYRPVKGSSRASHGKPVPYEAAAVWQ